MNATEIKLAPQGRRRGRYSDEFKQRLVEACRQPGVSTAAVALANGINANLLRRWVTRADGERAIGEALPCDAGRTVGAEPRFVQIAAIVAQPAHPPMSQTVRIEMRCGERSVVIDWPLTNVAQCAALLDAVLK